MCSCGPPGEGIGAKEDLDMVCHDWYINVARCLEGYDICSNAEIEMSCLLLSWHLVSIHQDEWSRISDAQHSCTGVRHVRVTLTRAKYAMENPAMPEEMSSVGRTNTISAEKKTELVIEQPRVRLQILTLDLLRSV